jgi:phage FluMu gp28-like protein
MPAILPGLPIDHDSTLSRFFLPYQIYWIQAEDHFHAQGRQAFALAEKSVRIGWTFCDAFKNVRKRLRFKKRDYLFATKDWPSALEYMNLCYSFSELLNFTRAILSHGEDYLKVPRLDADGKPTGFTDEIKIGLIKFDNGSRIIAFSSNPRAMAVYGGDVGLDEFAKHPNAKLLWETAQGRVAWGGDLSVWSAHDGEDTLFNQFAHQARAALSSSLAAPKQSEGGSSPTGSPHAAKHITNNSDIAASSPQLATFNLQPSTPTPNTPSLQDSSSPFPSPPVENQNSKIKNSSSSPWNLYFRVTMPDALELGLLNVINRTRGTQFTAEQFLADCQARSGSDEVFQQSYLCNPLGAATASIVEWSAIERCRFDYEIERVHLESEQILQHFGEFNPRFEDQRESKIHDYLDNHFKKVLKGESLSPIKDQNSRNDVKFRLGFDVAASGQGDLAVIYIDEVAACQGLWLSALFTCRTEDWHFLKTVLFYFMQKLRNVQGAGDESGLGRQICWEATSKFGSRFLKVNFTAKKQDLGFSLMNQLSVSEKRFPHAHQDIAADYFALRKLYTGTRWMFNEGRNTFNPSSHCDIAWAGALSTHVHTERRHSVGAAVFHHDGSVSLFGDAKQFAPFPQ